MKNAALIKATEAANEFEMDANTKNLTPLDRLMPLQAVANILGRSVREIWREISRGRLPRPVPGRPARLFESDVAKYLNRLREERDKNSDGEKE